LIPVPLQRLLWLLRPGCWLALTAATVISTTMTRLLLTTFIKKELIQKKCLAMSGHFFLSFAKH